MFEPLSIGAGPTILGYAALTAYARGGSAVSSAAYEGELAANCVVEKAENSLALFGIKASAIEHLRQVAFDCRERDWDSNGAEPIDAVAIYTAESIIYALPQGIPMPEIAAEPDGNVSLDWSTSRSRVFSISAGRSGRLAYAWLDGADQGHAVARFDYKEIPSRILMGLASILDAPVRS